MKKHGTVWLGFLAAVFLLPPAVVQAQENVLGETAKLAAAVPRGLILEVGCEGQGELALALARVIPSYRVYAVSWDDARVQAARRKIDEAGLYGTLFARGVEAEGLPFPDECMNIVVGSTDEFKDEVRLKEALRVLRPDGTLVFLGASDLLKKVTVPQQTLFKLVEGTGLTKVQKLRPEAAGDWSQFHFDASCNRVSNDRLLAPPLKVQWTLSGWKRFREYINFLKFPDAVANQHVLVFFDGGVPSGLVADREVTCVDAYNGLVLWKRNYQSVRFPILADRTLYLVANGKIKVLDAMTGEERQTCEVKGSPWHLIYDGKLLSGMLGKNGKVSIVFAVDAATGKTLWTREVEGDTTYNRDYLYSDRGGTGFCAGDGRIFGMNTHRGKGKGTCWALNAADGKELWTHDCGAGDGFTIIFAGGKIFVYSSVALMALDAADGHEVWKVPTPKNMTGASLMPVISNGVYYLCNSHFDVLALDAATGRELYQSSIAIGWGCCLSTMANGIIYRRDCGLTLFSTPDKTYREYAGLCPACGGMALANGMLYVFRPGVHAFAGGGTPPAVRSPAFKLQKKE